MIKTLIASAIMVFLGLSISLPAAEEDQLMDALADDNTKWNATRALSALQRTNTPPLKALHETLNSKDYQQRQCAADILRRKTTGTPSKRLLEVTLEGLRDDNYPDNRNPERPTYTFLFNATQGVRFLTKHGLQAKDLLLAGLDSDDSQQRFLCAYALGMNGIRDRIADTTAILLFHLRDNDIAKDACMACAALYRLGPATQPFLEAALANADKQQETTIRLLLLDFKSPPKNQKDLDARKSLNTITSLVFDPAVQFHELHIRSFSMPSPQKTSERRSESTGRKNPSR